MKRDAQVASENAVSNMDSGKVLPVNDPRRAVWWLVVREDPVETLTIRSGGESALPIFSFREEAELFAYFEAGEGWLVWEMRSEEVLQILRKSPATVRRVCLDPLPLVVGSEVLELVSLSRERFESLLASERFSAWPVVRENVSARERQEMRDENHELADRKSSKESVE